jgi:predicted metal-dependent hydrolase
MGAQLEVGGITLDVVLKDIRNVHLSVYPPAGRVRIAAPLRMSLDTLRVFAIAKLPWIRQQQQKLREQERDPPREYLNRESHHVWGRRVQLRIVVASAAPRIELKATRLVLTLRPPASPERCRELLSAWYRDQVRQAAQGLIADWGPKLGVRVDKLFVQHMKTRWGSCSPGTRAIRLNTELAKKPPQCLEYIVVHEMVHLLEPTHNERFIALMDRFLPSWRQARQTLNRLPIRHEEWGY